MTIYLIGFILSSFLFYISEKIKQNKIFKRFIIVIALIIPCLIAGLRDISIGTDIRVYVKPLFEQALNADTIKDYYMSGYDIIWRIKKVSEFEYGFTFFVYLITKLFSNLQVLFFSIQAFIIVPIYLGLKKYKSLKGYIWLAMLVFYFMLFSFGLNIMRQMIGISICFYAISCLLNNNISNFKFILLVAIACLFHKSSSLVLLIYFMYGLVMYQKSKNIRIVIGKHKLELIKLVILVIVFLGIVFIFNSKLLSGILEILGFDKYLDYLGNQIQISKSHLLIRIPIILLFIFNGRIFLNKDKNNYLFLIIFLLDLLFANLASATSQSARIGFLFQSFYIVSLPLLITSTKKNTKNFNILLLCLYVIVYWYVIFVIYGSAEVIPYKFYI